jgi:hypothetical protein
MANIQKISLGKNISITDTSTSALLSWKTTDINIGGLSSALTADQYWLRNGSTRTIYPLNNSIDTMSISAITVSGGLSANSVSAGSFYTPSYHFLDGSIFTTSGMITNTNAHLQWGTKNPYNLQLIANNVTRWTVSANGSFLGGGSLTAGEITSAKGLTGADIDVTGRYHVNGVQGGNTGVGFPITFNDSGGQNHEIEIKAGLITSWKINSSEQLT